MINYSRENLGENSWLDSFTLPEHLATQDQFVKLWSLKPKERGKVKIWGKEMEVPRWQKSYLRNYTFSGLDHQAGELPEELVTYLEWAKSLDMYNSQRFNQVLSNWYDDGHSYIGSHSDDESQLVKNSPILSISLGATRKFRIRDKNKKIVKDLMLENGAVVVMGGSFQKEFKHEIVKISGKKGESIAPRINITFRQFL